MRFAIPFRPRLVDTLRTYTRQDFTADLTAGVTVGIVALPLAMAFAIASGARPEQGLYTAIVGGLLAGEPSSDPLFAERQKLAAARQELATAIEHVDKVLNSPSSGDERGSERKL